MSFQITLPLTKRVAGRYVGDVRRALQQAFARRPDVSQADIARELDVNRSVITRQLRGSADMSVARVAEIAAVLGFEPRFSLQPLEMDIGQNEPVSSGRWEIEITSSAAIEIAPRPQVRQLVTL